MSQVIRFAEIEQTFIQQAHTMVWCNAASVDRQDRPRSRVLHPIWEVMDGRPVGWIATGRYTLKTKHLEKRPYLSLAYIANPLTPIYVDCQAEWADVAATRQRIWDLFKNTPPPLGYDPGLFFGTAENPEYGALKLIPWRIELGDLFNPQLVKVWHASD